MQRHKNDTKTFEELDFAEQAKSISAQILVLEKAIKLHVNNYNEKKNDPDQVKTRQKCIDQLTRMISRL